MGWIGCQNVILREVKVGQGVCCAGEGRTFLGASILVLASENDGTSHDTPLYKNDNRVNGRRLLDRGSGTTAHLGGHEFHQAQFLGLDARVPHVLSVGVLG